MPELTVAAGLAKGLIEVAVAAGASAAELAERSGIAPAALDDQDARIPLDQYVALMRSAKALTGDPALALRYGATVHMSAFSVVGLIFYTCETIAESIEQVNRYGQLIVETGVGAVPRFQFERRDGRVWMVDTRPNPNDFPELTEATFARFISMTRPFSDGALAQEMHVSHSAPAHWQDYERICGVPVTFEAGWNAVRVDEGRLTQRIATQPRYAFGILSEHAEALLVSLESSKTVRGRVEGLAMPILHTGKVSVEAVAREMGVSRQTLFRKLKAEGTSFEQVLDELRHKLALHYLAGKKASVHETAYLVGFSDRAAFSRAFKRWTGQSPSALRGGKDGDSESIGRLH